MGRFMLPGARPDHAVYAALQDLLHEGIGRTIHFHWTQNGSAFPVPGQPMPGQAAIDAVYQRALLETNYGALDADQRRFVAAMRGAEVRVTTPRGTDIRFGIGDRPVNLGNGDASKARTDRGVILIDREIELPAGAIRVAPLEETVTGTIAFPPSQWNGRPVEGLRIRFERGRIVDVAATRGLEDAQGELAAAPEPARAFREFALGFNPLLAVPDRNPWDSVLRLRCRRGPALDRRQLRAGRHGHRRLCPLELLHRRDGQSRRRRLGARRSPRAVRDRE